MSPWLWLVAAFSSRFNASSCRANERLHQRRTPRFKPNNQKSTSTHFFEARGVLIIMQDDPQPISPKFLHQNFSHQRKFRKNYFSANFFWLEKLRPKIVHL